MKSEASSLGQEILGVMSDEWQRGADIRNALNAKRRWWRKIGGPRFYQEMARLRDAGLVSLDIKDARIWLEHDEYVPVRVYIYRLAGELP